MTPSSEELTPVLGKYQNIIGYLYYQFTYAVFYFITFHTLYIIWNLDYFWIVLYIIVMILQRRVKRNQRYIDFVTNVLQYRKGLKSTSILYQEKISNQQSCIFGFHPHGVLSTCIPVFMNYPNSPFQHAVGLSSRAMLIVPFTGLMLRLWGLQSVDGRNMKKLMRSGKNIGLLPGGFEEATLTVQDQLRIFIKERKGFIKYALQNNYTIYPVLVVNEHKLFWTFRYLQKLRLFINKFKLPAILYFNWKTGLFIPRDVDFIAIVGKGIKGRQHKIGEKAVQEEIDEKHAAYIEQIKRIYEKHKHLSQVPIKIL